MSAPKTLAMRRLEAAGIGYDAHAYPSALRDAAEVAAALGVPAAVVFKTLVVVRPAGRPILAIVAADRQLDLKRLAAALGEKRLQLASHADAERLTGLQVGGISALAVRPGAFDVVIDAAAGAGERMFVSAGQRGLNLALAPADLARATGARWVEGLGAGEP